MKKAKTSKGLQILLTGLMVLVFAFTVGFTFCASLVTMTAKSNPYSTTTYAGMQQHTLINDTVDNPIPFGYGAHNFEVSLNYSYSYNFDVRFAYSIYWTDASGSTTSLSTDNVILLYANRDGYIVDDDYIYYVGTDNTAKYVSAGTGKLPIFTGVEFADYEDERYFGATLSITIGEIKISKASSLATDYTTSHALVAGITEKPAAKAWLKYKNNTNSTNVGLSEANAYAMVYNYRYKIENGIDYPKYRTAYKKVSSGGAIRSVTWLGGNRFYAGMAVYIVTGNTPVTLTAKITNSWQSKDPINDPLGAVTDSNHFTNFATDWQIHKDTNGSITHANYTKTIPSNSVAYIEIADSIEISCLTLSSETADFTKGVILSNINLNNGTFAHSEYVDSNSMLLCKEISANTMEQSDLQDITGEYSQKQIDIINSTVYSPLLYNTYEGAAETTKVNITVTNNSAKKLSLSGVSYVAKVYISNGSPNIGEWEIITYTNSSWISGPTGQAVDYLAPFSSITIVEEIQVNYNLKTYIEDLSNMGGCYDAWIVIDVQGLETPTETSTNTSKLCAEASTSKQGDVTTVTLYAKNETKEVVNNLTINLVVSVYECNLLNARLVEDSTTFLADYWKYYTKSGTEDNPIYSPNISNTWYENTYYSIDFSWTSLAISNVTTYNSFTNSGNKFTNTSYVLAPSERVKVATFTVTSTKECNFSNICFSGTTVTGGTKSVDNSVNFVNEGTSQAYIINNSTSSYYVRFTGSLTSTTDSRFAVIGVYTYYIGLIRPGQILAIPMEATESAAMSVIQENDGVYTSNTLNSWEADESGQLHQLFEAYFN